MTLTAQPTGPPDTDATLIEQSWDEPELFAGIFERHFSQIHQYLARRAGDRSADDLAAEVFVIAFAQRRRFDVAHESARPWLYGIATNLLGTHRRQEQRMYRALARTELLQVSPGDEERVTDRVSAEATGPALAGALAALDDGDRDVLLLVALAEFNYQQVAQALGIPYGTVCSRLHRARRRLRAALGGVNPADDSQESLT